MFRFGEFFFFEQLFGEENDDDDDDDDDELQELLELLMEVLLEERVNDADVDDEVNEMSEAESMEETENDPLLGIISIAIFFMNSFESSSACLRLREDNIKLLFE